MWINLEKQVLEEWAKLLETNGAPESAAELRKKIEDAFHEDNAAWVSAAKELYQRDGEVEVDEQSDGSAMISVSEDGGAYVLAWVWLYNEDAGFPAKEDEDEEVGEIADAAS